MECSAKSGQNIEAVFSLIAETIVNKIAKGQLDPKNEAIGIKLGSMETEKELRKKKECCQ